MERESLIAGASVKGPVRYFGVDPTWILIAAVWYVCLLGGLDAIGLVGPDEPRYAEVAREMALTSDWVTPRLWGRPWFEKPILYYWTAAAAFRVFGVSEFAARLPSALAALLAALGLVWAAKRQYGWETAWTVALIFPTCAGVIGFARASGPDMLFSASLALAMVASVTLVEEGTTRRGATGARIAWGVFLGAATLAKGPAAIVLAGGGVASWALVTRRWGAALRLLHPIAVVAWAATALPWHVLCAKRNPEFVRVFLYEHNFERYLTPVFRHEQPVWFFLPVILIGLLPWTALLTGVASDAWRARKQKRLTISPSFFFACWGIFPLVFFSLSKSKLPGYVLPVVAPLAAVMAASLARSEARERLTFRWQLAGVGVTMVALIVGASAWLLTRGPQRLGLPVVAVQWPTLLMVIGGFVVAGLALRGKARAALLGATALVGVVVAMISWVSLPSFNPYISARPAAEEVRGEPASEMLYVYKVHRATQYQLNFYQRRELPEWTPDAPLPAWVFTTREGIKAMEKQGRGVRILNEESPQAMLVYVHRRGNESQASVRGR